MSDKEPKTTINTEFHLNTHSLSMYGTQHYTADSESQMTHSLTHASISHNTL
jgi:hypothetical protein